MDVGNLKSLLGQYAITEPILTEKITQNYGQNPKLNFEYSIELKSVQIYFPQNGIRLPSASSSKFWNAKIT